MLQRSNPKENVQIIIQHQLMALECIFYIIIVVYILLSLALGTMLLLHMNTHMIAPWLQIGLVSSTMHFSALKIV